MPCVNVSIICILQTIATNIFLNKTVDQNIPQLNRYTSLRHYYYYYYLFQQSISDYLFYFINTLFIKLNRYNMHSNMRR